MVGESADGGLPINQRGRKSLVLIRILMVRFSVVYFRKYFTFLSSNVFAIIG